MTDSLPARVAQIASLEQRVERLEQAVRFVAPIAGVDSAAREAISSKLDDILGVALTPNAWPEPVFDETTPEDVKLLEVVLNKWFKNSTVAGFSPDRPTPMSDVVSFVRMAFRDGWLAAHEHGSPTREATLREAGDEITRALDDVFNGEPAESEQDRCFQRGMLHARTAVRSLSLLTAPPQPPEPEPVEIPNVLGADGPFKLGSAISAIGDVVDVINGDSWKFTVDDHRRALEQIRVIVDDALGPPPADGLARALKHLLDTTWHQRAADNGAEAIDNHERHVAACENAVRVLAAYERERAKEQGQ